MEKINGVLYTSVTKYAGKTKANISKVNGRNMADDPSGPTILIPGDGTTTWDNLYRPGNFTTGVGTISDVSGNAGATFAVLPANTDGLLEWTVGGGRQGLIVGLSTQLNTSAWNNVEFGIYMGNANLTAFESTFVNSGQLRNGGLEGNVLGVRVQGGVFTYESNGVPFYTSQRTTTEDLYFSIFTFNVGDINSINMQY